MKTHSHIKKAFTSRRFVKPKSKQQFIFLTIPIFRPRDSCIKKKKQGNYAAAIIKYAIVIARTIVTLIFLRKLKKMQKGEVCRRKNNEIFCKDLLAMLMISLFTSINVREEYIVNATIKRLL